MSFLNQRQGSQIVASARLVVSQRLHGLWWYFLLRGLLAIALAACALFWPQRTIELMVKILGVYFIFDGAAGFFAHLRIEGKRPFPIHAIICVILGLVLLFWSGVSVKVFLVLTGLWAVLLGVDLLYTSWSADSRDGNRASVGFSGLLIAFAGIVLAAWPATGVVAVSWLIGICALAIGLLLIFVATRLKRARKMVDGLGAEPR